MSEMDVSTWKSFKLKSLFGAAKYGVYVNPRCLAQNECGLRIVSASTVNNGVSNDAYVGNDAKSTIPAGVITWGKQSPMFAWQSTSTISGQGVYYYDVSHLTKYQALFVCAVMQTVIGGRYNYQECLIGNKADEELISLPATSAGTPDWDYMENYMKAIMEREEMFAEHLASLTVEAVADGHDIDVSDWGEFRVGDLFDIRPTKSLGKTNQYLFDDNGQVPVVVNSAQNNGIGGYTMYTATENGGIITFSDTTDANSIFYQHEPFVGYSHVQGMYPKCDKWSETSMLFFVGVFKACALDMGFSYANKFRRDLAANLIVKLPITSIGTPDWAYMEQFMQQQMDKSQQLVEHLDQLI